MSSPERPPIDVDRQVKELTVEDTPHACGVTVFDADSEGRLREVETFTTTDKAHARQAAEEASRHHRGVVAFEDHKTTQGTVHEAVFSCETFPSR